MPIEILHPEQLDYRAKDLSGQTSGRLTALLPTTKRAQSNGVYWLCVCSRDNNLSLVRSDGITREQTKSCGCLQKEKAAEHFSYVGKHLSATGSDHGRWKGGVSPGRNVIRGSPRYNEWRLDVYHRDNFTCQKCGKSPSGELNAHHIVPFAVLLGQSSAENVLEQDDHPLWNIDNGVTLCEGCHKEFHEVYGLTGFTSSDFEEWIN